MSLTLEIQYLNLLSPRLRNFKQKRDYLWNFSCPLCGDSDKNKRKARGYVFRKRTILVFKCHNCGESLSFVNLLAKVDPQMFDDFTVDRFKSGGTKHKRKKAPPKNMGKAPVFNRTEALDNLQGIVPVSRLPKDHPCAQYVRARGIPAVRWKHLYYTDDFGKLALEIDSKKYQRLAEVKQAEERLVIPFLDRDKQLTMIQGRALGDVDPKFKYMTLKVNEELPKVFGLERADLTKRLYVVEGPIDSLFLHNAVATADANLAWFPENFPSKDPVLVFDNEPRSKEIVSFMEKAQKNGYRVCIWDSRKEKDINAMVLAGCSPEAIKDYIDNHSYTGLELELKLAEWSKANVRD